jgi:hypothetical protein
MEAEFNNLRDSVLFRMIVVCLHHAQHFAVVTQTIPICGAVVASLQLDDPDTLTCRTTVLLQYTWLECHGLLEACNERCFFIGLVKIIQGNVGSQFEANIDEF